VTVTLMPLSAAPKSNVPAASVPIELPWIVMLT
jgi:hypothetical protein